MSNVWKHPLQRALDAITFENRDNYVIQLNFNQFKLEHFNLIVKRLVYCSLVKSPRWITNGQAIPRDISADNLVKIVFVRVGQFEAHEFCESFKYNGVHAYFPHDTRLDKHVAHLYGKSNRINRLLLDPWTDIALERSSYDIAMRFLGDWVDGWYVWKLRRDTELKISVKYAVIKFKIKTLALKSLIRIKSLWSKKEHNKLEWAAAMHAPIFIQITVDNVEIQK